MMLCLTKEHLMPFYPPRRPVSKYRKCSKISHGMEKKKGGGGGEYSRDFIVVIIMSVFLLLCCRHFFQRIAIDCFCITISCVCCCCCSTIIVIFAFVGVIKKCHSCPVSHFFCRVLKKDGGRYVVISEGAPHERMHYFDRWSFRKIETRTLHQPAHMQNPLSPADTYYVYLMYQ